MNFPTKVKQSINLFFNRAYIPREILRLQRPIVMHISDTPAEIYPYIYQVLEKLQPEYLIHTGDMVDNIKLEIVPGFEPNYHKSLEDFIKSIESMDIQKIYYIPGNHDQKSKMESLTEKGVVMERGTIELEGISFYLDHYYTAEKPETDYHLYGHSFEPKSHQKGGEVRLNGLEAISVISLKNEEMKSLPYPLGTNGFRKMEQNYRSL